MESKGFEGWWVIKLVLHSTQTQTVEHTQREIAAVAAVKVGAGNRSLSCK